MAAATRSWTFIPDTDVDPLSCVTTTLMFQLRNNLEYLYEYIGGEGYLGPGSGGEHTPDNLGIAHDHDGINSAVTVGQLIGQGQNSVRTTHNTPNSNNGPFVTRKSFTVPVPAGLAVLPSTYQIFVWAEFGSLDCNISGPALSRKWVTARMLVGSSQVGPIVGQSVGSSSASGFVTGIANLPISIQFQFRTASYIGSNCSSSIPGQFNSIVWQLFKES